LMKKKININTDKLKLNLKKKPDIKIENSIIESVHSPNNPSNKLPFKLTSSLFNSPRSSFYNQSGTESNFFSQVKKKTQIFYYN
jgi:hypothetical protein